MPASVDYLANISIAACAFVVGFIYCSVAFLPAWDDGTGFVIFNSFLDFDGPSPQRVNWVRNDVIPKSARLWAANLSVEIFADAAHQYVADVFDARAELGAHNVMRVKFCKNNNNNIDNAAEKNEEFCICDEKSLQKIRSDLWNQNPCVSVDERQKNERNVVAPDNREVAVMLRYLAQIHAEKIENAAFDRLVIRLRHYFQTSAGIDTLFNSIFEHQVLQVEEAPIAARHVLSFVQPRLPPKQDKMMKLNFFVAEKDSRWVHELVKDAHANALTHAPFVFPMILIFTSCLFRVLKGSLAALAGMIKKLKAKKRDEKTEEATKLKKE